MDRLDAAEAILRRLQETGLQRLQDGKGSITNIKFIRYPVDENGFPIYYRNPVAVSLLMHEIEGCNNGKGIVEMAWKVNKDLDEWEIDGNRIGGEFKVMYVIDPEEKLVVSSQRFMMIPKNHIFYIHFCQLNVAEIKVFLKRRVQCEV